MHVVAFDDVIETQNMFPIVIIRIAGRFATLADVAGLLSLFAAAATDRLIDCQLLQRSCKVKQRGCAECGMNIRTRAVFHESLLSCVVSNTASI